MQRRGIGERTFIRESHRARHDLADLLPHRFMGGYAIVGGHIPLAAGLAFATKYQKLDLVTVCFFGEGAVPMVRHRSVSWLGFSPVRNGRSLTFSCAERRSSNHGRGDC